MTTPCPSVDDAAPADLTSRPPLPSIAASALLETRMLAAQVRRTVASWLTGPWTGRTQ
jgi:hypothetical protein